jgi:hypothetical protein
MHHHNHNHNHKACDGRGIALDDLQEIALTQRRHELWQELFQNAARIGHAARSNAWLRPLFRKYKHTCREILDQKRKEIAVLLALCDDCQSFGDKHQARLVRDEMNRIHEQIKNLDDMPSHEDNDTDSDDSLSTDESDNEVNDNEVNDNEVNDNEVNDDEVNDNEVNDDADNDDNDSSSSSSSSDYSQDLEDFM